jgi:hypothetical protein
MEGAPGGGRGGKAMMPWRVNDVVLLTPPPPSACSAATAKAAFCLRLLAMPMSMCSALAFSPAALSSLQRTDNNKNENLLISWSRTMSPHSPFAAAHTFLFIRKKGRNILYRFTDSCTTGCAYPHD